MVGITWLTDCSVVSLFLSLGLASVCFYYWAFVRRHYWKVRGVPYLNPVLPVFGNIYDIILLKTLPDVLDRIYKETKGLPYVGIYAFHSPVLFVRDLDLTAKILVNDFNNFVDRGFHFNEEDSIGRNLIHQNGADWKFSRSKLSPCFNIAKVKSMFPTIKCKSEVLVESVEKENSNSNFIEIWDMSLRYTTDVLTLYTMGVDANSLQDKTERFREVSRHMLGKHFIYHVFVGSFSPTLHKWLGISVAKAKVTQFFHSVVSQVINFRRDSKSDKKDIIQTLMQLKEESASQCKDLRIKEINDNFIVGQSFIFFLAGFETPGNILACTLYEIAKHPNIQEALCTEIATVLKKYDGEVTFDSLQDMKYLRQVIAESLRMYTPLTLILRRCTDNYTIPGTSTVIEKGTLVIFPLRSIHHDPQYYPDPDVFDPNRFSDENSAARHNAAYMPFGIGPRFCPAVMFSHIEMRTALVYILRQFQVSPAENTPPSIRPNPQEFLFSPKNGIPLVFKKRQTT